MHTFCRQSPRNQEYEYRHIILENMNVEDNYHLQERIGKEAAE